MNVLDKIDRSNVEDILNLSKMQEGILFHYLTNRKSDQYFEHLVIDIEGKFDSGLFKRAWDGVVANNEMLRTIFIWENLSIPVQIILKKHTLAVREYDLSQLSKDAKEQKIEEIMEEDKSKNIDIRKEPVRLLLFKLGNDQYKVIVTSHHILYDGWSNGIIITEFLDMYSCLFQNKDVVRPIKNKFKNYVEWCRNKNKEEALSYWKQYLNNYSYNKKDLSRDVHQYGETGEHKEIIFSLDNTTTNQLRDIAIGSNTTLNVLFQTIWGILLQRYYDVNDIVYGSVVSGRAPEINGIENMVGLFINTLPIRITSEKDTTFLDVLRQVQDYGNMSEKYSYVGLVDIQTHTSFQRGLFDNIMVFENYPVDKISRFLHNDKDTGFKVNDIQSYGQANYSICITIIPRDELIIRLSYNTMSYSLEAIQKIGEYIKVLINSVIENYHNNKNFFVKDLDIVDLHEKLKIISKIKQNLKVFEEFEEEDFNEIF